MAEKKTYYCLLLSDFTIDNLAGILDNDPESPIIKCTIAPFDSVTAILLDNHHNCWREKPDLTVVWTRPENVSNVFRRRMNFENVKDDDALNEVDLFTEQIKQGAERTRFVIVPSWTIPPQERGYALLEYKENIGLTNLLARMNLRLAERLKDIPNVYVIDSQRWVNQAGRFACNPKLYYMGKVAFNNDVFSGAAKDIKAALTGLTGGTRKLVLLDLDDTLWGGIIGEVGTDKIRLGGHDPVGEAFVDFQRRLKALINRGILLGIISKNEESVALDAIRNHPEMILRLDNFVGWRINWNDKAQNIADLTAELNLGLQSVVFIDNSNIERDRVREALPELLVPEWPEDPMLYKSALQSLTCFDSVTVTAEDAKRTEMYVAERERRQSSQSVSSVDDWLRSLNMVVSVAPLDNINRERTLQLINKTNQMNMTTRRLSEDELIQWVKSPDHHFRVVRVLDKFGDTGLVGIVSLKIDGNTANIIDFILSCRVFGRKVEETMLHIANTIARDNGASILKAKPIPTKKNKPCFGFFDRSGFTEDGSGVYDWSVENEYPLPDCITLKQEQPTG